MDNFFQLTGHKGGFKKGTKADTILKLCTGNEELCLRQLSGDARLNSFVPHVVGVVQEGDKYYLEMQNLLVNFQEPAVMDIKMGCRTYREQELGNPKCHGDSLSYQGRQKPDSNRPAESTSATSSETGGELRPDMYEKMVRIDQNEPSEEENRLRAVTKPRYMIWRETTSSTASLGFRIEGMRLKDGTILTDFKLMKEEEDIHIAFSRYFQNDRIRLKYLNRLEDLHQALTESDFFSSHEIIGSSLLFVHDDDDVGIWMIDFAKTYQLDEQLTITHHKKWELGNHEDGYLTGLNNLIRMLSRSQSSELACERSQFQQKLARGRN